MTAQNPLIEVAEFVARESPTSRVAVIFDLDSTLFCVSPRTEVILRHLADEAWFKENHPGEAEVLGQIKVQPTDWGVRVVLERANLNLHTARPEFFRDVRDYWHRHFFSSRYLDHDAIYPLANEYVRHLHSLGADIWYLTGRPEASMRPGTIQALRFWRFPFYETKLIMKPSEAQTDESFKANVLMDLVSQFDHVWFFENEPVIIEQVRRALPQLRIIFMNSVHAGRAPAPLDLPTIGMDYSSGVAGRNAD